MLHLYTGLPGASKTLNTITTLVQKNDCTRTIYYNNVKLLMLDMDVCNSFEGWFYGYYLPNLDDKSLRIKLDKIIKRVHDTGDMVSLDDVPFLFNKYDDFNNIELWLYWVKRLYSKKQLEPLSEYLSIVNKDDVTFESLKRFNLHFVHFDNPLEWHLLPKRSIIFIDEVQEFFPVRSAGSKVPDGIKALEKHRHSGWDLHWITQDAMLIDVNARRQTGFHCNYYNAFGGKRLTKIESPKVFNPSDFFETKNLNKSSVKHNTNFYGSYWSAEIHTHKFKVPKFFYVGIFSILLFVLPVVYFTHSFLSDSKFQKSEQTLTYNKETVNDILEGTSSKIKPINKNFKYKFLDDILKDVYITGSLLIKKDSGTFIDYVFEDSKNKLIFHPDNIGVALEPVSLCLVKLTFDTYHRYITCNPLAESIDSVPDELEIDSNQQTTASTFKIF